MKRSRLSKRARGILGGHSRGMTLIEVVIALALFAIIAITFLGGLTTAARAVLIGDIRTTSESLARAQLEYIKTQEYSPPPWDYQLTSTTRVRTYDEPDDLRPTWWTDGDPYQPPYLPADHAGYTVAVVAEPLYDESDSELLGIQKVTITVSHEGKAIFTLEGYNRGTEPDV